MLRPTFLSFETAKRALSISQIGLDTVGHNIANVKTEGYTRQRVDQVSISSSGYKTQFQPYGVQFPGMGSVATGINQIRDPFLDKRFRDESATFGELGTKDSGLADINNVLDEIMKEGPGSKLTEMIKEINKLGQSADSKEIAVVVRSYSQQVAQMLNKTANELEQVAQNQKYDLDVAVADDVNNTLKQISILNSKIKEDNFYGNPANELNDERNMLIDKLAGFLDINVVRTPVKITDDLTISQVSIELKNSSETGPPAKPNIKLVDGGDFKSLKVNEDSTTGEIQISLHEGESGFKVSSNINDKILKGGIKGFLDVLNGKGVFADVDNPTGTPPTIQENTYRGIPYYQEAMDVFAQKFASFMNDTNSITAQDIIDNPALGVPDAVDPTILLPTIKNLFVSDMAGDTTKITAKNIQINQDWLKDEMFFTTTKNTTPPTGTVTSKNDNVYRFITGIQSKNTKFQSAEGETLYTGSFEECMTSIQSTAGLDLKMNDNLYTASYAVISNLADRRDSISAVSIDEEGINMMTYQNYYNAAARYMTTLDEALGTIIQGMGVVGR